MRADARAREEIEVIERNALRLGKLVNTLLDFSRLQAGRIEARFEPVDLAATTAELASVFRSAVERAGLDFAVDCPPVAQPVYVDLDMWEKVVLNLLSNAVKFTFEGGIAVAVRQDGDSAVLTVATPGPACRPRSCPGCSSGSTGSSGPARAPARAAASAWPWCASWSDCTAAPSPPRAPPTSAPRSP